MTTIVDTGPLVAAAIEVGDVAHACREALRRASRPFIVPAPVTSEVDHLFRRHRDAAHSFVADIRAGRFLVECLEPGDYDTVLGLMRRYADLTPGIADLSLIVLAHRYGTRRIMTIDGRHFRVMTSLDGQPFTLIPADGN